MRRLRLWAFVLLAFAALAARASAAGFAGRVLFGGPTGAGRDCHRDER